MIFKDESEVFNLVAPIIELYKGYDQKNYKEQDKCIDNLPDFYPNYKAAVKAVERIKVHAEIGKFPAELFKNRYPNQTDKEFEYMKANYKQNTLPVFSDYIATNTRPFSEGNWDIVYEKEETEDSFQKYVENEIEITTSLKSYVKNFLPNPKSIDANGVVIIKPNEIYVIASGEELIIDDTKRVTPQPYYYPSIQVLSDPAFDDDYLILESKEKSMVDYAGKMQRMGRVFEVLDQESIWKVEQVGKYEEYNFNVSLYYYHGAGYVMGQRLKGVPVHLNDSYIWQSPFLYACDLLDRALVNDNYLNCSLANNMFPYRIRLGMKCNYGFKDESGQFQSCDAGLIFNAKSSKMVDCPKCKGTGLRDRITPGGEMLLYPSDFNSGSEGDAKFSGKAFEIVGPPTEPSKLMIEVINDAISKAYEIIKAKRVGQATGSGINPADGTATKEILDQKAQYNAVRLFIDQTFDLYQFLLDGIGWQRYGSAYKKPTVKRPASVDFNTEEDFINRLTKAQTAGLPPFIVTTMLYQYMQTQHFTDKAAAAEFNLVSTTDLLFGLSKDDVLMKFNRGLCQDWQVILHDSSYQLIDELQEENKDAQFCGVDDCTSGFFALPFTEQQAKLVEKAKAKAKEFKPVGNSLIDKAKQLQQPQQ